MSQGKILQGTINEEEKMKKLISLLLVLASLVSLFGVAFAENTEEPTAEEPEVIDYKISDYQYNGEFITGKIVMTGNTPTSGRLYVRIYLFCPGNIYFAFPTSVYEDGTFELQTNETLEHITIGVFSKKGVSDPSPVKFDAVEFDVM